MRKRADRNKYVVKRFLFFILLILVLMVSIILFSRALWIRKPLFVSPVTVINSISSEKVEKLLVSADIRFSSVSLAADSSYVIKLSDGGEVVLSSKKDIAKQIASLQQILKQLTIEGIGFKRLDFRFDKPVVEYTNNHE